MPQMEHDTRYDHAAEWIEVIKLLWSREEDFDYEGKFVRVSKGFAMPKPIQKPFPALMNAGGSEKGRHFAAKYCDIAFVVLTSHDLDEGVHKSRPIVVWRARNMDESYKFGAIATWCTARRKRRPRLNSTATS